MHLSQDELSRLIINAKQEIEVGARYQHYKSKDMTYRVENIAIQEADNEPCVIYKAEYGNSITFSRPVKAWLEIVEFNGEHMPRFTKIEKATE